MGFLGLFGGGKKSGGSSFEYQPYGGLRPPRIDYTDAAGKAHEIFRPTQQADFDITMAGAKGEGVGYDPARRTSAQALLESQIGKQREDDVRSAQGQLAASGLSGNPRAYEALAGRVNRDAARTLGEQTNALNIEDLGAARQDRENARLRLANLNRLNFGQEDKAADFDLSVYGAEQGNRLAAANFNEGARQYDQNQGDEFTNSLLQGAGSLAGMYFGGPTGAVIGGQAASALSGSGKGIGPTTSAQDYLMPPGYKYGKATRALAGR